MDFAIAANLKDRKKADVLAIPFFKTKKGVEAAADLKEFQEYATQPIAAGDFKGKEGEILFAYMKGQPEKRLVLFGLGDHDKITTEIMRRACSNLTKACHQKKVKEINIVLPVIPGLTKEGVLRGIAEGLLLSNYSFTQLKHDSVKENPPVLIDKVTLIGADKADLDLAKKYETISEGVYMARDLINGNADDITPKHLVKVALNLAKTLHNVKATIFDKKRIVKEKMGLLLAVNRGSELDPAFIILEYKGKAKAKDHTILIGKGITYDTGGLNLKSSGMDHMKSDMGGAAVALATVWVAATLRLPVHLTAVIPTTENSISAKSYKPGDVYVSHAGKTVEITNTDAEGRLVLADALSYACKHLKPTRIIDFATLTGGIEIALGGEATGMMSNDDALSDLFIRAGSETYERVWRLPLFEEYKDNLRSDVADIKNAGTRSASSITAAIFLQHFINGKVPWVHFDIASTAFYLEAKRYHPKYGTGIGVRLMIEFLESIIGNQ